jgi:hypothetical protein
MPAEIFKAISRVLAVSLRGSVYTTIQGIRVLQAASRAGHQAISLQLAFQSTLVWAQMAGPLNCCIVSTASWMAERPTNLNGLTRRLMSQIRA